jgi:hypothetical protein
MRFVNPTGRTNRGKKKRPKVRSLHKPPGLFLPGVPKRVPEPERMFLMNHDDGSDAPDPQAPEPILASPNEAGPDAQPPMRGQDCQPVETSSPSVPIQPQECQPPGRGPQQLAAPRGRALANVRCSVRRRYGLASCPINAKLPDRLEILMAGNPDRDHATAYDRPRYTPI